jgi:hypothetical protein
MGQLLVGMPTEIALPSRPVTVLKLCVEDKEIGDL